MMSKKAVATSEVEMTTGEIRVSEESFKGWQKTGKMPDELRRIEIFTD